MVAWLLILSLSRDVWQIRLGFNRILEATRRLEVEQAKNDALKAKLNLVMTDDFREKIIREKLNMQKEGEILAVMPEKALIREVAERTSPVPNWRKWWNLVSP